MPTFTDVDLVTPLDFTDEELDIGDTTAVVTKINGIETKLETWSAELSTSITSINAFGAELETAFDALNINGNYSLNVDYIRYEDGVGTYYTEIRGADDQTNANIVWKLPTVLGATGEALTVASESGGTMVLEWSNSGGSDYPTTGGTLTGDVTINKTTPALSLTTSGTAKGELKHDGTSLVLTHFNGGTTYAKLTFSATEATFDTVVRGEDPVGDADFATKGYVDPSVPTLRTSNFNTTNADFNAYVRHEQTPTLHNETSSSYIGQTITFLNADTPTRLIAIHASASSTGDRYIRSGKAVSAILTEANPAHWWIIGGDSS